VYILNIHSWLLREALRIETVV